ncbi:MAG: ABC transporter [Puniceicoccaceae bacterium 5H]|nr:MAG: ABC transporter [Puniceicoccaceae bacterium 5H]
MSLKEYSLYKLLSESKSDHHANIRVMWANPDNHYLVLFEDGDGEEKAVMTVGPTLDYTSLDEVDGVEVGNLKAKAFVRCRHCPREGDGAASTGFTRVPFGQSRSPFGGSRPGFGRRATNAPMAPAGTPLTEERLAELKQLEAKIEQERGELENLREELRAREAYLTKSENRLSSLADQLIEKEAELAEREDRLNAIADQQASESQPSAS